MRILHISDVHVPGKLSQIPWRDWMSKRVIGGANYLARRKKHFLDAPHKLLRLAEWIDHNPVDVVLCSGDLTTLGTDTEFEAARHALMPIIQRAPHFATIYGNHDAYVDDCVREKRYEKYFGRWDLPSESHLGDHGVLIRLNSAHPHWQPWRSDGSVSADELQTLEHLIARYGTSKFIIVITHYAMRTAGGDRDTSLHGLGNADALEKICKTIPHGAVLHGHIHRGFSYPLSPGVRVFCAGSATQHALAGFWLLTLRGTRYQDWRLDAQRGYWHQGSWQLAPPNC